MDAETKTDNMEREYIRRTMFLLNNLKAEIEKANPQPDSYASGQVAAYNQCLSLLQEALDFTDPDLYVMAKDAAGKTVHLHWEGNRTMGVESVEQIEYGRAILRGKLQDGTNWETDAVSTEPLKLYFGG